MSKSWLNELLYKKKKMNRLSILIPFTEKEMINLNRNIQTGLLDGEYISHYRTLEDMNRRIKEQYVNITKEYDECFCKYKRDSILTEEMINDLVDRADRIRSIQNEISMLNDEKCMLEDDYNEKIAEIQEKYNRIYLNSNK